MRTSRRPGQFFGYIVLLHLMFKMPMVELRTIMAFSCLCAQKQCRVECCKIVTIDSHPYIGKNRIVSAGCCPDYCEDLESSATSVKVK